MQGRWARVPPKGCTCQGTHFSGNSGMLLRQTLDLTLKGDSV